MSSVQFAVPLRMVDWRYANVTLLSAVLLLADARSLILMLLPSINRTKLYFFVCFFSRYIFIRILWVACWSMANEGLETVDC